MKEEEERKEVEKRERKRSKGDRGHVGKPRGRQGAPDFSEPPCMNSRKAILLEDNRFPSQLRLEYRRAGDLLEHPLNWRRHSAQQKSFLERIMKRVGWCDALLMNERTGRLLDGHLRKDLVGKDDLVPVLIGDWTEEEEALILQTFDPISTLAEPDEKIYELVSELAAKADAELEEALSSLAVEVTEAESLGEGDEEFSEPVVLIGKGEGESEVGSALDERIESYRKELLEHASQLSAKREKGLYRFSCPHCGAELAVNPRAILKFDI